VLFALHLVQNADDQQRECAAKDEQQHVLEGEVRDLHEQMRGNLVQWEAAATAGQVKDEAHARLWKQVRRGGGLAHQSATTLADDDAYFL
jgi:hypothetical protein